MGCMDIRSGARNGAIFLIVWNVLALLSALFSDSSTGAIAWNIFFAALNIACWALVLFAFSKNIPKLLIPGMIVCLFDVVSGVITAIFYFIFLLWLAAFIILIFAGLTAYFFICLKNNYDDMGNEVSAPSTVDTKPQNPV